MSPQQSGVESPAYKALLAKKRQALQFNPVETKPTGHYYNSPNLNISDQSCKGTLFKKIENVKFYHKSQYHEKLVELNFDLKCLHI